MAGVALQVQASRIQCERVEAVKELSLEFKHATEHCVVLASVDSSFLGGNKGAEANMTANVNS